jgi:hypothetical protein
MNKNEWLKSYRKNKKAIWINVRLTNGEEFYFDEFDGWRSTKIKCDNENIFIEELSLQFRSHEVKIDVEGAEAFYLIRSVMGQMGGKSKNYYTTGVLKDGVVHKKMWIVPELIVEKEFDDNIEECFEEALIYDQRKNR